MANPIMGLVSSYLRKGSLCHWTWPRLEVPEIMEASDTPFRCPLVGEKGSLNVKYRSFSSLYSYHHHAFAPRGPLFA